MFGVLVEELMGLDDADVTERFRQLELRRRRDDAEMAALISVVEARGIWANDGHLTVKGWLRANANWSNADVACQRKKARLLNDHPAVGDAMIDGHIGLAQAAELARARSNRRCGDDIGRVIDQLTEHAEQLPYEDFRTVVRRWEILADADGAHRDAEATNERRTVTLHEVDGGIDLRGSGGSALTTAGMLNIFDRFVEAEFRADVAARTELHGPDAPPSLLPRTDAQRRFDALVKIFETAAAMPAGARSPKPVVHIMVSQERFEYELTQHGLIDAFEGPYRNPLPDLLRQYCETDNGVPVVGHDVLRAAIAGHVRRVVIDSKGVIVNAGRERRLFTGAVRAAMKLMIRHCETVGCDIGSTSCQIDHIDEWVRDGGRTDTDNGGGKCGGHNRIKHRLGHTERRDRAGKLIQFRRDGTPILPVGQRLQLDDEVDCTDFELPDLGGSWSGRWPIYRMNWVA
jgi:Domain of unknown function (DUF222)